jgi:hypothetical protein
MKIYQDKSFLYEHYVRKRMNLKDIVELMENKYGTKISEQGLYNWLKKYDLLKYRGKGRTLGANLRRPNNSNRTVNPNRAREKRMRQMQKKRRHK